MCRFFFLPPYKSSFKGNGFKIQKGIVHEVKEKHDYCTVIEYGLGSVNKVWVFMEFLYFGYLEQCDINLVLFF